MAITVYPGTATLGETASGTSVTCNVPSGVVAGDLLVATVAHSEPTAAAVPDQSGWTTATKATTGNVQNALFYRVATASEPASYTFTGLNASGAGRAAAEMVRLSGVDTTTPLDATPGTATATGTSVTTPSVTTVTAGALMIYSVSRAVASAGDINVASGTTLVIDTTGTGRRNILASEARPTAGATSTRAWTATDATSLAMTGIAAAFRPSAAGIALAGAVSTNDTGSVASLAVTVPAGAVVGEILLAHIVTGSGSAGITPPAGWTVIQYGHDTIGPPTGNAGDVFSWVGYRVVTGTEAASYTWTFGTTSTYNMGSMTRVTGVNTASPVRTSALSQGATKTQTFAAPALTGVAATDGLFEFWAVGDDNGVSQPVPTALSAPWATAWRRAVSIKATYAAYATGNQATPTANGGNVNSVWVSIAVAFVAATPGPADTTAPTVPSSVTATANSSTQVTVAWTASTDAVGVASYRVRQGGVDVTGHTADAGSPAVITGLSPSTSYSFTVSAVDAAGNRSAESTAATVTTPAPPDTTAPTVPTGVTATPNSSTQITVAWTASTDAVGVASYRVRQGGVDVVGGTAVVGTSFAVTGLTPSTLYSFTVSAVDAAGNRSAESTAATATTSAASDTTAPTVPSGVTATANTATQVTIAWTASTDAVGVASYRIRRGGVDLAGATAVTGTSFTDLSVVASTAYSYTVSAVDAAGNRSAESTAATATTPAPAPAPPAPTPAPVPPPVVPARRLTVSVYQGSYVQVGQVPNYVSCSVTWNWLGVGSGELVVGEDDPIASNLLMADQVVVAVVVNLGSIRWSGRVASVTLEREGPAGSGVITATLVDEWIWLQRMLASQNGASTSLVSMPQYDTRTGPAVSVTADYINAAAARLGVPVKASKPAVDASPSVTLKARMTPLADLLTDPLKAAGVTLTGQIWLPSDPQPPDLTTTLTTPTVVFRPQVLADKPWLQWTDSMVNIVRLAFQGQQPVAYRTIVGLSGTDAARIYDQVIDTTRQSGIGSFGLPEIYTDATEATLGAQSAAAGITALVDAAGTVSVSLEVNDGDPFRFGDDFVVGDLATAVIGGASWRQRITKLTVEDSRSGGLVVTPTLGERSDLSGDDMMVQALARVAESVRALQAGR